MNIRKEHFVGERYRSIDNYFLLILVIEFSLILFFALVENHLEFFIFILYRIGSDMNKIKKKRKEIRKKINDHFSSFQQK